jgi:hypothetical protein
VTENNQTRDRVPYPRRPEFFVSYFSPLGSKIFSVPVSINLNLSTSFNMKVEVSHPYKTRRYNYILPAYSSDKVLKPA